MTYLALLAIGLIAGVFAGMFGIGGGIVIVPALLLVVKMKELDAIATSLAAMIPPVGLLGAMAYYRTGHINIRYAALVALGIFLGAYFGARIMISLPPTLIRRLYGVFLAVMAIRMLTMGK
jgi:uncharacterized protein